MSDTHPIEPPEDYNAGNPEAVQGRARRLRREQGEADQALRNLLRTTPGRRWMWQLLASCHVFASTFRADPYTTAFGEGERSVGLRLLADVMRVAPEEYPTMAEENKAPS